MFEIRYNNGRFPKGFDPRFDYQHTGPRANTPQEAVWRLLEETPNGVTKLWKEMKEGKVILVQADQDCLTSAIDENDLDSMHWPWTYNIRVMRLRGKPAKPGGMSWRPSSRERTKWVAVMQRLPR